MTLLSLILMLTASSGRGECVAATSVESNTRAVKFVATGSAATSHSAPADASTAFLN